jgi:pSer/pThr/pTyr-binding forkhead associated (FHA) protein
MPELVVKLGDNIVQRYVIDKDLISIGRAKDNDIVIENLSVSRNHARIRRQGNSYVLTDLNSANGTFVNNVRVTKTEILDGDIITIGKHQLHFINKELSDSDVIVDALAAERTMVLDRPEKIGVLCFTEGQMKGKVFRLTKAELTIGKSPQCDIVLADDWFLAKKQAVIVRHGIEYEIRDLGTLRRTRINGKTLSGTQKLNEGDTIEIGAEKCLFKYASPQEVEQPAGRVPKELGLEDSIFASVSELPPELRPSAPEEAIAAASSTTPMEESEDWSEVEERLEQEAAAHQPAGIGLEDLDLEDKSRTFGREQLAAEAAVTGPKEALSAPPVGPAEKISRASRRKQRELERAKKAAEVSSEGAEAGAFQGEEAAQGAVRGEEDELAPAAAGREAGVSAEGGSPELLVSQPAEDIMQLRAEMKRMLSLEEQVALWEAALQNKSPVIRRQAAKMLKKLTGKDYAY